MSQNRKPPAYQEYAAEILATTEFRIMSLTARGLLYTMRLECWVNGCVPAEPRILARTLGYTKDDEVEEVASALIELQKFFDKVENTYISPELEGYRSHLQERKENQSKGGRKGAAKTNAGRSRATRKIAAGNPRGKRDSLVEQSTDQNSQIQPINDGIDDEWVAAYERVEFADNEAVNAYKKASRGY